MGNIFEFYGAFPISMIDSVLKEIVNKQKYKSTMTRKFKNIRVKRRSKCLFVLPGLRLCYMRKMHLNER